MLKTVITINNPIDGSLIEYVDEIEATPTAEQLHIICKAYTVDPNWIKCTPIIEGDANYSMKQHFPSQRNTR